MFFYGPIIEGAKVRQKRESGSFTFSLSLSRLSLSHSLTHYLFLSHSISFSLTLFLSLSLFFFLSHSISFSLTHTHASAQWVYLHFISLSLPYTYTLSLPLSFFLSLSLIHRHMQVHNEILTHTHSLFFSLTHSSHSKDLSSLIDWLFFVYFFRYYQAHSLSLSKSPQFFTSTWANCPQQFPLSLFASLSPFPECILKRTKKPIFCSTGLRYLSMSELLLINGERIFTYQMMRGLLKRQFKHTLVGLYRCFYCYGCTCFQISLEIYLCCYWY